MDLLVRAENGIHGTEYYLSIYRGENAVFGLWADASLFGMYEAGNRNLAGGIWSDGETLWAADTEDDKLYAYELAGGARDESKDFNTLSAAGNQDPAGIWSDRETMWVADSEDDMLYAYRMSDRTRNRSATLNRSAMRATAIPQASGRTDARSGSPTRATTSSTPTGWPTGGGSRSPTSTTSARTAIAIPAGSGRTESRCGSRI